MDLTAFAEAVREYRRIVQGSVTSWGRSIERNRFVEGCAQSPHLVDLGADVVPEAPMLPADRIQAGQDLGLAVRVLDDHDHVQPADYPPCTLRV